MSIFVNPLQFEPGSDFSRYPRPESADEEVCRAEGVDLIFRPSPNEMYADDRSTFVEETALSRAALRRFATGPFPRRQHGGDEVISSPRAGCGSLWGKGFSATCRSLGGWSAISIFRSRFSPARSCASRTVSRSVRAISISPRKNAPRRRHPRKRCSRRHNRAETSAEQSARRSAAQNRVRSPRPDRLRGDRGRGRSAAAPNDRAAHASRGRGFLWPNPLDR